MKPFHLVTELTNRVELARGLPKRTRTRYALIAGTAREMERVGYEALTIENIVEHARLARGTFYLYFKNRSDSAAAVMSTYRALIRVRRPRGSRQHGAYETILRMNKFYVSTYSRNAALLAGAEKLVRERPDHARRRDFWNDRWARAVLADVMQRSGNPANVNVAHALLSVRAVLAMADEFLREVFVYRSPTIISLPTDEQTVAEVLSVVWHRAVYGSHPEGVEFMLPLAAASSFATSPQQPAFS